LNCPANASRIQPDDLQMLERLLDQCEADEQVHVLIVTAGGKHFSAGYDAMKQTLNAAAFGEGSAPAQRATLAAAYDGPKIAERIMAAQQQRRPR
jgi:enoyl-CoA hydratase/carnithine racemase